MKFQHLLNFTSFFLTHKWWSGLGGLAGIISVIFVLIPDTKNPFDISIPSQKTLHSSVDNTIPLHEEPSEGSPVTAFIGNNSLVKVRSITKDAQNLFWAQVSLHAGWIAVLNHKYREDYMLIPITESSLAKDSLARVTYDGTDGLNLRNSPTLDGDSFATVYEGSILKLTNDMIDSETHTWAQIEISLGYIALGSPQNPKVSFDTE